MKWNTRSLVPVLVGGVALMSIVAVWTTLRPAPTDTGRPDAPMEVAVVRAPPIREPDTSVAGGPPSTALAGRADACKTCGVVEWIEATPGHASFTMSIRMSDGSLRTVEQVAPIVAGSRVTVKGGMARPALVGTRG